MSTKAERSRRKAKQNLTLFMTMPAPSESERRPYTVLAISAHQFGAVKASWAGHPNPTTPWIFLAEFKDRQHLASFLKSIKKFTRNLGVKTTTFISDAGIYVEAEGVESEEVGTKKTLVGTPTTIRKWIRGIPIASISLGEPK